MDRSKAQAMLEEARAELATAESSITYLRQVVEGLEGLLKTTPLVMPGWPAPAPSAPAAQSGHTPAGDTPPPAYPRPAEAVATVLQARPNLPMEFGKVWDEMNTRGLVNPEVKSQRNAYANAAQRLANAPEKSNIHRLEDGRYIYRTASDGPQTTYQPGEVTEEVSARELEVLTS